MSTMCLWAAPFRLGILQTGCSLLIGNATFANCSVELVHGERARLANSNWHIRHRIYCLKLRHPFPYGTIASLSLKPESSEQKKYTAEIVNYALIP